MKSWNQRILGWKMTNRNHWLCFWWLNVSSLGRSVALTCPDSVLNIIRWWGPSSGTGFTRAVLPQHVVKLSWVQGSKLSPERSPGRLERYKTTTNTQNFEKTWSKFIIKTLIFKCRIVKVIHCWFDLKKELQKHFVVIVRMTEWEKQVFSHHVCFHIRKQSYCCSLICMQSILNQLYDWVNSFCPCHPRTRCLVLVLCSTRN